MGSARTGGAIQAGERCEQTGPWRADGSGRIRMPVKGPRGIEGWITVDERRCQNALDKTFGKLCFKLAPPDALPTHGGGCSETKTETEDDPLADFLLAGYERDEQVKKQEEEKQEKKNAIAREALACGMSVRAYRKTLANDNRDDGGADEDVAEEEQEPQAAPATRTTPPAKVEEAATLTEAQKRLRNIQKKIREAE